MARGEKVITMLATAPPIPATTPRVLIFGHPGSGKSSLLGALLRASDAQPDTLEAEIEDPKRSLDSIRDSVYGEAETEPPRGEVIRHDITIRPLAEAGAPVPVPYQVVLLDCEGSAAGSLLKHPDSIDRQAADGTVAQAVVASDALILVVNAGESDAQLQKRFEDFVLFLERIHGRKTRAYEVGGFPIFLALTQCDRLVEKTDTDARWQRRIVEELADVLKKFEDFLADANAEPGIQSPYLPFGSIELYGYAVAVRRPQLADVSGSPGEPFGVAELFRDCFASAREHRQRVAASDRQLRWTVRSVLFAVLFMLSGVCGVIAFQPAPNDSGLQERVREFERKEPPASERLALKNINRNDETLRGFRSDAGFERLPSKLKQFVVGRLDEIEAYRAYRKSLLDPKLAIPADARTREELNLITTRLTDEFAPPPGYTWTGTEAVALRDKWLADAALIRRAEEGWFNWYWGLANIAHERGRVATFDKAWHEGIEKLFHTSERPMVRDILLGSTDTTPVQLGEPIPGSLAVAHAPKPRGEPVTFQVPHSFDRVYVASQGWLGARTRLSRLRDLTILLALLDTAPEEPGHKLHGVLDIPAPDLRLSSVSLPGERLVKLHQAFGPNCEGLDECGVNQFDEPARSLLSERLDRSFRNGAAHVRLLLEAELGRPASAATPDDWSRLVQALDTKVALRDWGRLLHVLAKLREPGSADPILELAAFLRSQPISLTLAGFDVTLPVGFQPRGKMVKATGPLTVTSGTSRATFKFTGQDERGTTTVYRFASEDAGKLAFTPGDEVRITVPVALGDGVATELVWASGSPAAFRYERLLTPGEPQYHQPGVEPRAAAGVKLALAPGSVVPAFPVLFPYP